MLGKSFLIGIIFAALSAGVVYFGVGETLEANSSENVILSPAITPQKQKLSDLLDKVETKFLDKEDTETVSDASLERGDIADAAVEDVSSVSVDTEAVPTKSDRTLLNDAKLAADSGLYLDSADIIADIQSPLMRDTARSNLALALARDGEKEFAMAVVDDVESQALAEIMRTQINQALAQ